MKFVIVIIFLTASAGYSQSGRMKPTETPSPTPTPRRIIPPPPAPERPRIAVPAATPTPIVKTINNDDEEVIRIRSTLVPIPVSVVDREGRAVRDLRLVDFELKIDGQAAEITDISRAQIPIRLAMLFDNSGSILTARNFQIEAAVRFFERVLRPGRDQGALFSVATAPRLEQPMTPNTIDLVRAIKWLPPPAGATALLSAVEIASEYLSEEPGRRVIVIVSDGDDTMADTTLEKALRTAQRHSCQIFVVQTTEFENFIRTGSRKGNANIRSLVAEKRMQAFANHTGGAVYMPIDHAELDDAFRRISADLAEQYILSYYPDNESGHNGHFRQIEVEVKRKADLTVRARKGYYVSQR